MKIAIANDHAGVAFKKALADLLEAEGHEIKNFGSDMEASVDYPDFAHPLSESVVQGEQELGILICGSGNGVAMSANKHSGIRAALCWNIEIAELARQHNNANVLCLPARFVTLEEAKKITQAFVSARFEGGRHERRIGKISC